MYIHIPEGFSRIVTPLAGQEVFKIAGRIRSGKKKEVFEISQPVSDWVRRFSDITDYVGSPSDPI